MKKLKFAYLIAIAVILVTAFATFTSCKKKNLSNNFVVNEETTITLSGKKGENITFPAAPDKTGYFFKGWYTNPDFSGSPVESGKFDGTTTYYALWEKACLITLNLDGGSCDTSTLYLEEGASVLEAVSDIVPLKSEHQFAGWYINDAALDFNLKAVDGIVLKARYKTKYVIKAKISDLDGETYEEKVLSEGYAFAGETISSDFSIEGFSASDKPTLVVSENYEENVLTITFDRNKYYYTVYEKYPDGTSKISDSKSVYYETVVELPTDALTAPDGYRFIGWADKENATYKEALTEKTYVVKGEVGIYPVWDKAYTDTFGGYDYLFIDRDKENSATLVRGDVSIKGTFDSDYKMYIFRSSDPEFSLKVKLDEENHRFIYYALNGGKYVLFDFNKEPYHNDNYYIVFTKYNEVEYHEEGQQTKEGTYTVTDDTYEVVLKDGTNMRFLLGVVPDGTKVYRVRGKEYGFGSIAINGAVSNGLTFTLDGFGNATVTYNGSSQRYEYTITQKDGEEKYYVTLSYNNQTIPLRVIEKDGSYVYDVYTKDLDTVYNVLNTAEQYRFDGCGKFEHLDNGQVKGSGTYTVKTSLLTGYVATLTMDGKTGVYYLGKTTAANIKYIEEKNENYAEYYYCDDEGGGTKVKSVIALNGDKATVYQAALNLKGETIGYDEVSEGNLISNGDGSYTYERTEVKKTDAIVSFETMTFNVDSSTGSNLFYVLEAEDGAVAGSKKEYISNEGGKLVLISIFGIYTDGNTTFKGAYKVSDNYSYITDGENYKFFIVEGDEVYVLSRQPMELAKIEDGKTDYNTTLVITGKQIGEAYEAIYTTVKKIDNKNVTESHKGSFVEKEVNFLGASYYVDVFTASDGSGFAFKFFRSSRTLLGNTILFFNYFDSDETMEITSLVKIDDDDSENTKVKLILTDKTTSDGKFIAIYEDADGVRTEGTFGEGVKVYAFGEENSKYTANKYTFTSTDNSKSFDFTLLGTGYFRVCAENVTYNSSKYGKLELDGVMHVARYTAKGSSRPSYNTYVLVDGVLGEKAVYTMIGETVAIFDLKGETFSRRGEEANVYYVVKNAALTKQYVALNGQGGAKLYDSNVKDDKGVEYTYEIVGENVILYNAEKVQAYIGKLSSTTVSGSAVNLFTLLTEGVAGAYLNETDLSVLVFDDAGKVIKYDSYGKKIVGSYKMLDDGVAYYCNEEATDAAVYTLADGKAVSSVFDSRYGYNEPLVSATYYANDFSSIVFYNYGAALYNNTTNKFFVYDKTANEMKTYEESSDSDANKYGFKTSVITLGDKFEIDGKKYYIFDGTEIEFADGDKKLTFIPTGAPEFTVEATLAEGETKKNYYVTVGYVTGKETPNLYLAEITKTYTDGETTKEYVVNGGADNFNFTVNYDLAVNFEGKTFTLDMSKYRSGIVAYNYDYIAMLGKYNSSMASIISRIYGGRMGIIAETENGRTKFSVWGAFNYITVDSRDENGDLIYKDAEKKTVQKQTLSFSGGELSKAGDYSDGHLYTVEFKIGTAEKFDKYHLVFRLYKPSTVTKELYYVFKVVSVSKVTNEIYLNADKTSVYYEESYVYTSDRVLTGTKDKDGNDEYYNGTTANGTYLPTLRVNGELIPSSNVSDKDGYRRFYFGRCSDKTITNAVYYFKPVTDENGNVTGGSLEEYYNTVIKDPEGKEVAVSVYTDGAKIVEIGLIKDIKGGYDPIAPESYTINSDKAVTVVISDPDYPNRNGTYILTFAKDENGKIVSASFRKSV
ncbi:MAG: InlB B-repeat-containing protein [Clostridia bacterium]|nr:InlB B-repeat-containing protein [Clostridia bacterium]